MIKTQDIVYNIVLIDKLYILQPLTSQLMFHGKGCCAVQWLRHFSASTRGDFATTSLRKLDRLNPGRKKKAFREDCARIWGNLYDYSTTKYQDGKKGGYLKGWCLAFFWQSFLVEGVKMVALDQGQNPWALEDNHTPVLIGCPLHGIFRMRPRDHIQRRLGCPKCGASIPGSVHDTAAMLLRGRETPRLGQHVLQSYSVADEIAKAAVEGEKHEEKWIAEIGVGTGVLTSALLRRSGCLGVVGFELDEEILKQGFLSKVFGFLEPTPACIGKYAEDMHKDKHIWHITTPHFFSIQLISTAPFSWTSMLELCSLKKYTHAYYMLFKVHVKVWVSISSDSLALSWMNFLGLDPSIPPKRMEHVFKAFFLRVDASNTGGASRILMHFLEVWSLVAPYIDIRRGGKKWR